MTLVALLIIGSIVLFVSEALRVDLVAMIVLGVVLAAGLATPEQALSGFSNVATLTVAAMYVLSKGLERTGLLAPVGHLLSTLIQGRGTILAIALLSTVVGIISAFINNTAAVAVFLPVIMAACREAKVSPSRLLLPLSFVSMAGGMLTLLGTSTNLLVDSLAREYGMEPFSLFEPAPLGLILLVVAVLYSISLGYYLTPERRRPQDLTEDFEMGPHLAALPEDLKNSDSVLVEAGVGSNMEGQTLRRGDVKKSYEATPLALSRKGRFQHAGLEDQRLRPGDTILFQVVRDRLDRLRLSGNFIILNQEEEGFSDRPRAALALCIILSVVVVAFFNWSPIVVSAIVGAILMVLFGCLTLEEAYKAIDWKVIFLLAGMLSLGKAMQNTGAASTFAHWMLEIVEPYGPRAVLAALYLLTTFLTASMSNNATAVLMAPVAYSIATEMGLAPLPFMMAVAFAASACFASPVGYQTNVMIYGPGRFKFMDFVKVGGVLNLIFMVISVVAIPAIWSF